MKLTIIVFITVLQTAKCNISGSENMITALIRSYFQENDEVLYNQNCKMQTLYDCLVECDCSETPTNCTLNSCIYTCYLFSKPEIKDCPKDLIKHGMVLSFLNQLEKSKNSAQSVTCHDS